MFNARIFSQLAPFAAALLLAGCAQNPSGPAASGATGSAAFAPGGGGFSVQMPGPAQEQTDPSGTRMFINESNGKAFIVGYTEFGNRIKVTPANASKVLDAARNGMVQNAHSKVMSETSITFQGHPGRDYKLMTQEGFIMHLRMILAETRLYQVGVATPKGNENAPEIKAFINSFRLTNG